MLLIIAIVQEYFDDNYCAYFFYDNNCAKFVQNYFVDYYAKIWREGNWRGFKLRARMTCTYIEDAIEVYLKIIGIMKTMKIMWTIFLSFEKKQT